MRFDDWCGSRVAVLGLGVEGRCAVQWLARHCACRSITAFTDAADYSQVAGVEKVCEPVTAEMLNGYDWVIKSPGFSPYRDPVAGALADGARVTSVSRMWFATHPDAKFVCITGSKGKSTTAALLAHLLRHAGIDCALGGNIGVPLLDLPDAAVYVLELSSYQCADLDLHPDLCCVLNLFPEHLDWHGNLARYYRDKLNLILARGAGTAVLPDVCEQPARGFVQQAARATQDVRWLKQHSCDDLTLHGGQLCRDGQGILDLANFPLPGRHNQRNLLVALVLARELGVDPQPAVAALQSFHGLPHRCQVLGEQDGIRYVDDSIATTPHASIAALDALGDLARTVIIVGGHDRGINWDVFARYVREHAPRAVLTLPENGPSIAALLAQEAPGLAVVSCPELASAVAAGQRILAGEGTLLLSPGAPSFTAYTDFAARGLHFAALAGIGGHGEQH